jgi:PPOX class probable F420-dependent enzyme
MDNDQLGSALARDDAAWAREHLASDVVAWLTTVAPDGRPQSSLISFYSQPGTPKLRNIARSSLVSFHLQSDPYGDHALIVEGIAELDPSIPPSDVHEAYRSKYREPLAHWGMGEAETAADFSVPVRIRATRVRVS